MSRFACLCVLLLAVVAGPLCAADVPAEVVARLGLRPDSLARLQVVTNSPDQGFTAEQAPANAPDILRLEACHVGGQRLLFKTTFARRPEFIGASFLIYVDVDNNPATGRQDQYHKGVDFMLVASNDVVTLSSQSPANAPSNTIVRAARVDAELYVTVDTNLPATDPLAVGLHLLSQRDGGRGDGTPHVVAQLPRGPAEVPPLPKGSSSGLPTSSDYRYVDDLVQYEKLGDKGLTAAKVTPPTPFRPGRACPEPTLTTTVKFPGKAGSLTRTAVKVSVLEDSGVARTQSPVSFGLPCPRGGVFDLANFRALDGAKEIPAQFTATAFWPDGSLKWVLVDFLADLAASEDKAVTVEMGSQVKRAAVKSPLQVKDEAGKLTILDGALRYVINKQRFNLLDTVAIFKDGGPNDPVLLEPGQPGMTLVDEQGKVFTSSAVPPERVVLEQQGPVKVVVRVEGRYGAADGTTYMRYVARLTFQPASWASGVPWRVGVAWTTVNDYLQTEFTDVTSLSLPLIPAGVTKYGRMYVRDAQDKLQLFGRIDLARKDTLRQWDDQTCAVNGEAQAVKRAPGIAECGTGRGSLNVAVADFWQRWPKGFDWDGTRLNLDFLPVQPGPDYGKGLPHYLIFNLCEGKYRFKWGMSFTDRFTLQFNAGDKTREALFADANKPLVAVLPAAWYNQTAALGPVAAPLGKQFAVWDKYVAGDFKAYMTQKERGREYGFLNYGDWYGERGRNWGNNEYDLGHGLFQAFLRTGNRDYYRWALTAARHQADVDLIHAYPDPFYVGGQVPHSVGHTGAWSEQTEHGSWQARYDLMVTAANGHNWADGMAEAWCLAGDAGVMQSALLYAEHVAWAMSPTFKELGSHERSAGWSLRAIMAIYRQTYDPEYLAAGGRIAAVALKEQKFDQGGTWPHLLPLDHSNGQAGVMGNNLFLIGVLLGGLQAYHEASGDPATLKSLTAGAQWIAKSWDEAAGGWPYSATPEGKALYPGSTSLNMLILQPLAYVAKQTQDAQLWHIVDAGLQAVAIGGAESFGKSMAQKIHFAGGILALLQEHYAALPDKGASLLSGDAGWYAALMAKTPNATRHAVRAPDEKVFFVQLQAPQSELFITRMPHGAMNKRSPTGTVKVFGPAGTTVGEDTFSTDTGHETRVALQGQAGDQFRVVVNDDQRGIFNLSGDNLKLVMRTGPEFRMGGIGKGKYWFFVPAGTSEFRLKLLGVHSGAYGAVVFAPGGQIAGQHQDANPGQALIPGAKQDMPLPPNHPEQGEVVIKPSAADTGKLWGVVLFAAGDLGVELQGVPPYLALTEQAWFAVKP